MKTILAFFTTLSLVLAARASTNVIQFEVASILNARSVTTFSQSRIVPLTADVDGAGGVATERVAEKFGNSKSNALPNDGIFPANDRHPEVVLHFSNHDGEHHQVRRSEGEDQFSFKVPEKQYSQVFLFLSSGHFGPAKIQIQLIYQDGSTNTNEMEVPDWYFPLQPGETDRCYLAKDLGKWNRENRLIEKDHHFIYGLKIHPATKVLSKIQVRKFGTCVMAFWGATGVSAD